MTPQDRITELRPTLRKGDYDCNVHKGGESFFRIKEDLYSASVVTELERQLAEAKETIAFLTRSTEKVLNDQDALHERQLHSERTLREALERVLPQVKQCVNEMLAEHALHGHITDAKVKWHIHIEPDLNHLLAALAQQRKEG